MRRQTRLVFAPIGIVDLGPAGDGGSQARRFAVNGIRHVAKCLAHQNGPWVCFNEFFAARVATLLELPIPDFHLAEFQGNLPKKDTWFCSKEIHPGGIILRESHQSLANREQAAGILTFDVWLGNTDRKAAHLRTHQCLDGERMLMIDHGHILLTNGDLTALRSTDFDNPTRFLNACPELCSCVSDVNEIGSAIERIRNMKEHDIESMLFDSPGHWIPDSSKLGELLDFLLTRRTKLGQIMGKSMDKYPNLRGSK